MTLPLYPAQEQPEAGSVSGAHGTHILNSSVTISKSLARPCAWRSDQGGRESVMLGGGGSGGMPRQALFLVIQSTPVTIYTTEL